MKCGFEGCPKPVKAKGLCSGHYRQKRAGEALRPLRRRRLKHGTAFCTFPFCDRPHMSHGYCDQHSRQLQAGEELRPLRTDPNILSVDGEDFYVPLYGAHGKAERARALYSPEDAELIRVFRWHLSSSGYARSKKGGLMHRLILGLKPGDPRQGDHINGDRLDNRRENLRVVTFAEQMQNKKPWGKSGHRNCHWEEKKQLWRVIVTKDGKRHSGGRHKELDDAIEAARALRDKLFTHANEDRVAPQEAAAPGPAPG
jgi:hypothetical protein